MDELTSFLGPMVDRHYRPKMARAFKDKSGYCNM